MGVLKQIKKVFKEGKEKRWYETYWAFDVHGTILRPNYDLNKQLTVKDFYPYAQKTLQLLTIMDHIRMIMWTSSYPHEIVDIEKMFLENEIVFDFVGKNPDISSSQGNFGFYEDKFYFNVMFEDKAGFEPKEWEAIYNYILEFYNGDYSPDPEWTRKY